MAAVDNRRRALLAQEAARIMVEEGVKDYGAAKRKATRHLGGSSATRDLPSNREIEHEVAMRMRMYRATPDDHAHLRRLREAALEAMRFLADYRPRLVGSVLAGTATEHSDVNLHLFADTPEEVEVFLHDANIPFERQSRRHQIGRETVEYPGLTLVVDGVRLAMTIFPPEGMREAPRSTVTGKPVERAKTARVAALLAEDDAEPLAPEADR